MLVSKTLPQATGMKLKDRSLKAPARFLRSVSRSPFFSFFPASKYHKSLSYPILTFQGLQYLPFTLMNRSSLHLVPEIQMLKLASSE